MLKVKLQLDDLQVESFDTAPPRKAKGTVFGEQCTCQTICTCPGCYTCDASCNETCGREWTAEGTCDASCGPPATCGYNYCGTYPNQGCPNSYWYCTDCQIIC